MFEVLETEKIVEGEADLTLIPARNELLAQLMAAAEPHPRHGGSRLAAQLDPVQIPIQSMSNRSSGLLKYQQDNRSCSRPC